MPNLRLLVEQLNAAFESGDLKFLGDHMTDDVQWNIAGQTEPVIGKAEFLKVCDSAPILEPIKITIKNMLIDGNKAALEFVIEATRKDGAPYRQPGCDIYHFRDDKFYQLTSYLDTAYDRDVLGCGTIHPVEKI